MAELKQSIADAVNEQINKEIWSSYLYLSMAAHFESENLKGFAHWMTLQVQEELAHAMKFYRYLLDRGGKIVLSDIKAPNNDWGTPLEVFEAVYAHEKVVTESIENLMALAKEENDFATEGLLQWFIQEQIEEEANASEIVERLKQIDGSPNGLFMYDQALGKRMPSQDSAEQA